jgi:twitching motility protein PilT
LPGAPACLWDRWAMNLDDLLSRACELTASDVHLKAGNVPHVRVNGDLRPLDGLPRMTGDDVGKMAYAIMTDWQKEKYKRTLDIDLGYGVRGLGRFRVNVFQQRGQIGMALRIIPTLIRDMEELNLPKVTFKLADERRGMVLVTGTTGSGKTTTLASIINYINHKRSDHIITIEDPIEFLHRDDKCFINQREVEVDTASFGSALRSALRQDPDVILVGEMRDTETMSTAMQAAETGHMVYSTLHTLDAAETIQRIISAFPPRDQKQIRLQLASTLKGIVSQRLVNRADGAGRVPACEVLISTEYIRDCIVNPDKTRGIHEAIAAGTSQYGMQTFDQSLHDLYTRGLITFDEACLRASNPDELRLRVSGISSTADMARAAMERASKVERFARS